MFIAITVVVVLITATALWFVYRHRRALQSPSPTAPFTCDFKKYEVAVPLKKDFRFAHEPLGSSVNGRFVGRKAELEALALRILFSEGGSFLVTGYRGVGKTSFVNQVVRKLEEIAPWAQSIFGETKVISVQLNVARPLAPAELMHHIIRRLYEELREQKLLPRLNTSLQDELKLAYDRTSFNMKRSLGEETETGVGLEQAGFGAGWFAALKGSLSYKKKFNEGSEYEFLGYDDKAAEHDIVAVARKLINAFEPRQKLFSRLASIVTEQNASPKTRLLIVFVFDELDKLEEFTITKKGGRLTTPIDELLGSLKNVFTTSGVSFVFVAGKDTQERWLEDLGKGDSVYESVFAYDKYLPCMWSDVNELCDGFVDWQSLPQSEKYCVSCGAAADARAVACSKCQQEFPSPTVIIAPTENRPPSKSPCKHCSSSPSEEMFCSSCGCYLRDARAAQSVFADFKKYLDFRGRGIPRRIIRGFNEYVMWNGEQPILVFSKNDIRRIRVYAELRDLLAANEGRLFGEAHEEVMGTVRDKRRLGVYYVIDWIFRQATGQFTVKDTVAASKRLSAKIAPAEEVALEVVSDIVDVLVQSEFLMEVGERLDKVRIDDVSAKQEKRYQLVARRLIEMSGDADVFAAEGFAYQQADPEPDRVGHYQLLEKIGSGGMGSVYRAWNEESGQIVAVKVLAREFSGDPQAVERFRRESQIMKQLRHQHIIKCYETGEDNGRLYIAMEYVEGIDLDKILSSENRLPLPAAVHIARAVAEGVKYLHDMGFIRNDIKPGNVMLSKSGNVYLMDFGITKRADSDVAVTMAGTIVGTPSYMSPEQVQGFKVDARSDVYSFGVLLYQMVTGVLPFRADSVPATMYKQLHDPPPQPEEFVSDLPEGLSRLTLRCLEKEPEKRGDSGELLDEIKRIDQELPEVDLGELTRAIIEAKRNVEAKAQQDTREVISSPFPPFATPPAASFTNPSLELSRASTMAHGPPPPPILSRSQLAPTHSGPITFEADLESSPIAMQNQPGSSVLPPAVPVDAGDVHIELTLIESGSSGQTPAKLTFPARTPRIQIGRALTNEFPLLDTAASRFHAAIEFRDGSYYLRDLNTANGTMLNGIRVGDAVQLHNDDVINIGHSFVRFNIR